MFAFNMFEWLRRRKDRAALYFECHITIEPIFEEDRCIATEIAKKHGFRMAELLMQKRKDDTPERSRYDTFMTGHSQSLSDIRYRMIACIKELSANGFKIWRYKIEDTVLDSRSEDIFGLVEK